MKPYLPGIADVEACGFVIRTHPGRVAAGLHLALPHMGRMASGGHDLVRESDSQTTATNAELAGPMQP